MSYPKLYRKETDVNHSQYVIHAAEPNQFTHTSYQPKDLDPEMIMTVSRQKLTGYVEFVTRLLKKVR